MRRSKVRARVGDDHAPHLISRYQTASSFPRRIFPRPGFGFLFRTFVASDPERGGGRSAGRRGISVVALVRRDATLARRGLVPCNGTTPRGAPPWRFSARGRAFRLRHLPPDPPRGRLTAKTPTAKRAAGERAPDLRVARLRASAHGTPHPRSAFRIVSGDAPHERGCATYSIASICSQQLSAYRSRFPGAAGSGRGGARRRRRDRPIPTLGIADKARGARRRRRLNERNGTRAPSRRP